MANIKDFFSYKNSVRKITNNEQRQVTDYLEAVKAFARTTYKSIYIIDYQKQGFEYVSDNPLFLCGHTAEEIKNMGYAYYFNYVIPQDLELLLKVNVIGFDFFEKIPVSERKEYTISYDFHIKNQENKTILLNQKLTPLYLTTEGKIWKALCLVSLSNEKEAGNIKIYRKGNKQAYLYNLEENFWKVDEPIKISEREKEILQLSARGFTIQQIADSLFISAGTVKFHRKRLFEKMEVTNISEAILSATNNKLI